MFCTKCGSTLSENGVCPVCDVPVSDPINPELIFDQPPAPSNPGLGLGIAGMVLGILSVLSLICCCTCSAYGIFIVPVLAGLFGTIGLILSLVGKKKSKAAGCSNTFALVGLITSIVGLVIAAVFITFLVVFIAIYGFAAIGSISSSNSGYYY